MKKEIEKMIELARLHFPREEVERLVGRTEHILEYVERLKEIDTSNIEATSHAVERVNAFRTDDVQKFEGVEKILGVAPAHDDNLFQVPKVIE